jgi:translation elongation factor EF-1alpha
VSCTSQKKIILQEVEAKRNTGSALECVHFKHTEKALFKAWNAPGTRSFIMELAGSRESRTGSMRP